MVIFSLLLALPIFGSAFILEKAADNLSKQYPYVVSIKQGNEHICTGTIITPKCVLTSALCLHRCMDGVKIEYNGNEEEISFSIYSERNFYNAYDVGLIKMKKKLPISNTVKIAQLNDTIQPGQPIEVIDYKEGKLESVSVALNKTEECQKEYGIYFEEPEICATPIQSSSESPCFANSGAPLIQNGKQFGLVSFCEAPNQNPKSTVFAKFPEAMDSKYITKFTNMFCQ